MSRTNVNHFVSKIRNRLNWHRLWDVWFWSALIGGLTMLALALFYVVQGYAVPTKFYWTVLAIAAIGGTLVAMLKRRSDDQAAQYADSFFGLKDSVASCTHFADDGHSGGFYDLQATQTQRLVDSSSLSQMRYAFPYRVAGTAALLIGIAAALGFKGPSDFVTQKLKTEKATLAQTEIANEELRQLIEELDESIDNEEERKLLDPDKLRQWVDELEQTKDRKEAMRQYAKLELKLNRAAKALEQRKDEKLLDKAAEELKKSRELEELSKKLKQKKYEKAAADLKDLKPEKLNPEDLKKLSAKRKELAKLKAAAKRMSEAAKSVSRKSNASSKNSNGKKTSQRSNAKSTNNRQSSNSNSSMEDNGQSSESSQLADLLEELDDAVEDLDESLEKLDLSDLEEIDADLDENECLECCNECENCVRAKLDELGKKLRRMARKRSARAKLKSLSSKCSQCQSQSAALVQARSAGGLKPGEESVDSFRDNRDELVDNGQNTAIKGIKGNGPSLTKVESADDGGGVSHRRAKASQREFKKQFESFVEREDIPEDLKKGVKNYFTNIHNDGE